MGKKQPDRNRSWSQPLTELEKEIIVKVCESENVNELRKWLKHVTTVAEGLAEKSQKQNNQKNALKELTEAVDSEVLEYWRMGGYRQPDQDADRVINAVKKAKAALDG